MTEKRLAAGSEDLKLLLAAHAAEARRAFLERECDPRLLVHLYSGYHKVPRPSEFVEKAVAWFPRLCCGLASVYLRHALGQGSVVRGWYGPHRHTFLVVDPFVVDLTADQFGGPGLYVGPLVSPWRTG